MFAPFQALQTDFNHSEIFVVNVTTITKLYFVTDYSKKMRESSVSKALRP